MDYPPVAFFKIDMLKHSSLYSHFFLELDIFFLKEKKLLSFGRKCASRAESFGKLKAGRYRQL